MKYIITETQYETLVSEFQHDPSGGKFNPTGENKVLIDEKVAYHATPDIYLNSIKQNGLVPKSENKMENHPERIYLFLELSQDKSMADQLWSVLSKEKKDKVKDYYVLKIDLTKIPNHQFYFDTNTGILVKAIYTYEPIPSSAIEVVKKIPVSELTPPPSAEEEREKEEQKWWNTDSKELEADKEKSSQWDDLMKQLEKVDGKDLKTSMDDLNNLKENISRVKQLIGNREEIR